MGGLDAPRKAQGGVGALNDINAISLVICDCREHNSPLSCAVLAEETTV